MSEKIFVFIKGLLIGSGLTLTFGTNSDTKIFIGTFLCAIAFILSLIEF